MGFVSGESLYGADEGRGAGHGYSEQVSSEVEVVYAESPPAHGKVSPLEGDPLWGTDSTQWDGYSILGGFSPTVDPFLDLIAPGQYMGYEGSDPMTLNRFTVSGSLGGIFQRDYAVKEALLKAGPVYFDIPSVSGGMLYSSFNSSQPGQSDHGWIGIAEMQIRLALQLTDSFFIQSEGDIFITTSGRIGFRVPLNDGPPILQLAYMRQIDEWTWVVYDGLRVGNGFFMAAGGESFDSVGRYSVGRRYSGGARASSMFDGHHIYLQNIAGTAAFRPVGKSWTFNSGLYRSDTWGIVDDSTHYSVMRLNTGMHYTGTEWTWSPYTEYILSTGGDFEWWSHLIYGGASTQITPNIRFDSRLGYFITQGSYEQDSIYALASLSQRLGPYTVHSAGVSYGYAEDIFGDPVIGLHSTYRIIHRLGNWGTLSGAASYSTNEESVSDHRDRDGDVNRSLFQLVAGFGTRLTDCLSLQTNYIYQNFRLENPDHDQKRNVAQAILTYRIAVDWRASAIYQYEHSVSDLRDRDYDDHLLMFRLTKYF